MSPLLARHGEKKGADPTAQERESGLCAVDVAAESNPDILRQMLEKGDFQVPPPLEAPPTVTKVGPTSLQVRCCAERCGAMFR